MKQLIQIASDFAAFYGVAQRMRHISDALNSDKAFERALVVIGVAGLVVIGMTL